MALAVSLMTGLVIISTTASKKFVLISFGVPQSSTLGPLLFLIYLNDVFQDIDYETILYADDATVVIHAKTLCDLFRAANESLNISIIIFLSTN